MTFYASPYRQMTNMREAMNRMFEESIAETSASEREMRLAVDIQVEVEAFQLTALVPGQEAEDLKIDILNNTVSLRGEFKSNEREDSKYLMCELPAGRFSRVITLPTALDPAKAKANIKNGVLRLNIPKAEAHKPKSIKVVPN